MGLSGSPSEIKPRQRKRAEMRLYHGVDGGDQVPGREGTYLLQITRGWVAKLRPKSRRLRAQSRHSAPTQRAPGQGQRNHGRHPQGRLHRRSPRPGTGGLAPPPHHSPPGLRGPFSVLPFSQVRKREAGQSDYAERPQPAWLHSPCSSPAYHPGPTRAQGPR